MLKYIHILTPKLFEENPLAFLNLVEFNSQNSVDPNLPTHLKTKINERFETVNVLFVSTVKFHGFDFQKNM